MRRIISWLFALLITLTVLLPTVQAARPIQEWTRIARSAEFAVYIDPDAIERTTAPDGTAVYRTWVLMNFLPQAKESLLRGMRAETAETGLVLFGVAADGSRIDIRSLTLYDASGHVIRMQDAPDASLFPVAEGTNGSMVSQAILEYVR